MNKKIAVALFFPIFFLSCHELAHFTMGDFSNYHRKKSKELENSNSIADNNLMRFDVQKKDELKPDSSKSDSSNEIQQRFVDPKPPAKNSDQDITKIILPIHHFIQPSPASGDPKADVQADIIKARNYILLGIILPYFSARGITTAVHAKEKMKDNGIVDATMKRKLNLIIFFGVLIVLLKLALAIYCIYLLSVFISELSACYIATMVYKSYDAPEVLVLRKFRDEKLKPFLAGRIFIFVYYSLSPLFVKIFRNNTVVNKICRDLLDRFVQRLNKNQASGFDKLKIV